METYTTEFSNCFSLCIQEMIYPVEVNDFIDERVAIKI
jgi:hypothetical protein